MENFALSPEEKICFWMCFSPQKTRISFSERASIIASVHYTALFKGSTSWLLTVKVSIPMALAAINAFLEIERVVCVCMCVCVVRLVADLTLERLTY